MNASPTNASPTHIAIELNGTQHTVPAGITVVAALSLWANGVTRVSVLGEPRAAFCGMGICQECRVTVNGQRRLACQTVCLPGMVVHTTTPTKPGHSA
ncbi:MAG: hypothetical protein A3F78_10840 [Burkholderiales bacterium RIFCSPLOWO2_12_FULL_61_40]|nr:MAG: hypothetical protein A3F78_10840 [Burkholderiales bacterium RIFCSPLOWO2_12_FULL_61_40]